MSEETQSASVVGGSVPGAESAPPTAPSTKKAEANRRNAQHSTGPKTVEGKAKSAQNAIKHGIFAKRFLLGASAEAVVEMETLIRELRDHYQPVGKLEEMWVEKIGVESARYARILGFEEQELSREFPFFNVGVDRFGRYTTSTNRALSRAMEDLERLQAERKGRESATAAGIDDEE